MRINEITDGLKPFTATVRVKNGTNFITAKTLVFADGQSQAKAMLLHMYGQSSVLTISEVQQQVEETQSGTKTLSSAELAVKSMSDQAKRLTDQAKQMKARQALAKAQKNIVTATGNQRG